MTTSRNQASRISGSGPAGHTHEIDLSGYATTTALSQAMPIGAIIAYGGSTAPTGWHLCDGSAHGSSALQTLIGSANAPDLRGRFVVGVGDSTHSDVPTVYARGDIGGKETVTLTINEMPSHYHQDPTTSAVAGQYELASTTPGPFGYDYGTQSAPTSSTGGGGAHENRPPYYALTYIIKKA